MEGVILQEIVLRPWSDPPFLRKLCFSRGMKRNFNGNFGFHTTKTVLAPCVLFAQLHM